MITLDEKVVAIWYLYIPAMNGDYMAAIREIKENDEYEVTYRFRYYNPANTGPFESGDRKNWYQGTIHNVSRYYVIESYRAIMREMKRISPDELYEFINDGDFKDFIKRFQEAPFAHVRMYSKEEAEKIMKENEREESQNE